VSAGKIAAMACALTSDVTRRAKMIIIGAVAESPARRAIRPVLAACELRTHRSA
jgi:hypothetical protein